MKISKFYGSVFLFILVAAVNISYAQTKVSFKAGLNYSNIILEDENGDQRETQSTPGLRIGLSVDVPIRGDFYIQPELFYSRKGFKQKDSWYAGLGNDFKVNANYVELPVNILYKPTMGSGKLLVGAGPYLGYGTGGNWEAEETVVIGDIMYDDHGDVFFTDDAFDGGSGGDSYAYGKALDYGVNFLLGYEFFNTISAQFNIQLGLANLQPEYNDGTTPEGMLQNIGYGLVLGYTF